MGDLIAVMDHLWFQQIILFSASTTTQHISKTLKQAQQVPTHSYSLARNSSSSLSFSTEDISSSSSFLLFSEPELSSESPPPIPPHLDDLNKEEEEEKKDCHKIKKAAVLKKSMSCRSLGDLELEEVKGFMDLGFVFNKEHLNPTMLSLVPGLQWLGYCSYENPKSPVFETTRNNTNNGFYEEEVEEEGDRGRDVVRPYLSEAWLIRKPNSPLLNMRLPRATAAADMKKHLLFWARTVASEVQQES